MFLTRAVLVLQNLPSYAPFALKFYDKEINIIRGERFVLIMCLKHEFRWAWAQERHHLCLHVPHSESTIHVNCLFDALLCLPENQNVILNCFKLHINFYALGLKS